MQLCNTLTWNILAPYGVRHAFRRLSFPVLTNHLPAISQKTVWINKRKIPLVLLAKWNESSRGFCAQKLCCPGLLCDTLRGSNFGLLGACSVLGRAQRDVSLKATRYRPRSLTAANHSPSHTQICETVLLSPLTVNMD